MVQTSEDDILNLILTSYRLKDIENELSADKSNAGGSKKGVISQMFAMAKKQLKIPISKPEVIKLFCSLITITRCTSPCC